MSSAESASIERVMGGEQADVLLTDPPYGVDYVAKTTEHLRMANDHPEGLEPMLGAAFAAADAVLSPRSHTDRRVLTKEAHRATAPGNTGCR